MPGTGLEVLPSGERALLVQVADLDAALAVHSAVRASRESGDPAFAAVVDTVPAARTVLLHTAPGCDLRALADAVRTVAGAGPVPAAGAESLDVEVPVRYEGADLDEVAVLTGLSTSEVVAAHTGTPWRVGFGGFAPGFAYLVGGDPRLVVPRRSSPRAVVPAGSVGLAGEFSGIYPRSSPGGWQLIGRTDVILWDSERDPPASLQPGMTVRFVEARS